MTLLSRFLDHDRTALARLISHVENRAEGYHQLLAKVFAHRTGSYRVGITGPPGAGKSSLVNKLALQLAEAGKSVGVIAVDPSSPFTGGAVLGDRIRMQSLYGQQNVFVRSMATRGSPGGLASATKDVCVLLEGFGFDVVLVETVGVGQVELDVAAVCDTVVVVFVPESGDAIQAMKSGLMEIADVFCINKSDRPGADRVKAELETVLDVRHEVRRSSKTNPQVTWDPPVTATSALEGKGIEDLWIVIEKHRESLNSGDPKGAKRARARSDLILSVSELVRTRFETGIRDSTELEKAVDAIVSGTGDPYTLAHSLFHRMASRSQPMASIE